jgi:hypothetical protein
MRAFAPGGEDEAPTRRREGTFVPGGGSAWYIYTDLNEDPIQMSFHRSCGEDLEKFLLSPLAPSASLALL